MATNHVTLVVAGGTPVRLADQKGAVYPTTGRGSLVFSDGATLNDVIFDGFSFNGPLLGLYREITSGSSANITANDAFVGVRKPATNTDTTLVLPNPPTEHQTLTLADVAGTNSTFQNIFIDGNGRNINGLSSITLFDAYASVSIFDDGTQWIIQSESP